MNYSSVVITLAAGAESRALKALSATTAWPTVRIHYHVSQLTGETVATSEIPAPLLLSAMSFELIHESEMQIPRRN